jgi:signal transduction histidine kinase
MRQKSPQKLISWKQWLMPRSVDGLAAVLYFGVLAVYSYFLFMGIYPVTTPALGLAVMVAAVLAMIGVDRLEYRYYGEQSPWRITITFLLIRLAIIIAVSFSDGFGWMSYDTYFPIMIPFVFFLLSGNSYGLSGIVWMFYLMDRWHTTFAIEFQRSEEPAFILYVTFSMVLLFIFSIAFLIRQERTSKLEAEKLLGELELSHQQLQNYARQVAESATIEERNRLAREIHDSLGHYITVVNVQLEKAIAFRDTNPAEADQAIKDAKHLASEALNDVRQSVSALRTTPEKFSLTESLDTLVKHMENDRLTIDLEIGGNENDFSRQSLVTLYRAAQEGLTNIQKHAHANHVTIRIKLEDQEASLSIIDNGQGFDPTTLSGQDMGTHYGLQGIKERMELVRGSFRVESTPNEGTSLLVTVPKNPMALIGG